MDPVLDRAARRLAAFDPLGALNLVALRDEPEALTLRGVAMAQLGDYQNARRLLRRAARALETRAPLAHARCLAALGEVELADRHLTEAGHTLDAAIEELEAEGDYWNATFARLQRVKHLLLVGSVEEAAALHDSLDTNGAPARLTALTALVGADIAARRLDARKAQSALEQASRSAHAAALPLLTEELERARHNLNSPVARIVRDGTSRPALLEEVEEVLQSEDILIDACRRTIRSKEDTISLVTRPVLLGLCVALGCTVPHEATRETLAIAAFGSRRVTDSVRARLRVEVGRLRRAVSAFAEILATPNGYALFPRHDRKVAVLLPPEDGEASALLALLRAGGAWPTSALAVALGVSQRAIQRALSDLRDDDRVEQVGRGRSQRWVARPPKGFATTLLLDAEGPLR